jgi:NADH-quinone oxidoreductase subunit I
MAKRSAHRKLFGMNIIGYLDAMWTGLRYLFVPRATVMYPEVAQEFCCNYRGMLKWYDDRCISCTMCARICPSGAIKMYKSDTKKYPGINYQRCVFCGFCRDICPVNALEYRPVHDKAYYTLDEQLQKPQEFVKGPSVEDQPTKKVKPVFDEKRGLAYDSA